MPETRPDPQALLRAARAEEARAKRGRLKVFFGASPGVGKTFAMLAAAQRLAKEGVDVVVGIVETHGRAETEAMLLGLDVLPRKPVAHRGATLMELDLDAALARRPEVLLIDELAHTNVPGDPPARHEKRWQDVKALVDAGLTVYTTLNVQHLESASDLVSQITGVPVRETVPDSVLEEADEVELVDVTPDVLLERLREGKVYMADTARTAMDSFFRRGNLTALREIGLRRTAEWVDRQMRDYKQDRGIQTVWPAGERIIVCVSPAPSSPDVLRAAKRMAVGLRAELIALFVEPSESGKLSDAQGDRVVHCLRLAERLGAQTVTLAAPKGRSVAAEIVAFARARNAGRIVVGKPAMSRWREWLRRSPVDELIRASGEIDILVVRGESGAGREHDQVRVGRSDQPRTALVRGIVWSLLAVALATAPAWLLFKRLDPANIVPLYLLAVVVVAARLGRWPSVLTAALGVAAFDFIFVPPNWTFAVSDVQYIITFAVMLVVGLLISNLTARVREEAEHSREREARTASLFAMSRELAAAKGPAEITAAADRHVRETFDCGAAILLEADGQLANGPDPAAMSLDDADMGVARWTLDRGRPAGIGTSTLPASRVLCLPLEGSRGRVGVLALRPRDSGSALSPRRLLLLETFAHLIAVALERGRLIEEAQRATLAAQTERARSALLSSVSHDLRTPLAVIAGASSALLDKTGRLDPADARTLIESIDSEAHRLNELIANLIFATRLESGDVDPRKDWCSIEEIVGACLARLKSRLAGREVAVHLPRDLPLVRADAVLIEQVLHNLIENAQRHTPEGIPIEISAWAADAMVIVQVADEGPGLAPGEEQKVFDRFYRGSAGPSGMGLGLTICRGIVAAHGGRIWAQTKTNGRGAAFRFSLPLENVAPGRPETEASVR